MKRVLRPAAKRRRANSYTRRPSYPLRLEPLDMTAARRDTKGGVWPGLRQMSHWPDVWALTFCGLFRSEKVGAVTSIRDLQVRSGAAHYAPALSLARLSVTTGLRSRSPSAAATCPTMSLLPAGGKRTRSLTGASEILRVDCR